MIAKFREFIIESNTNKKIYSLKSNNALLYSLIIIHKLIISKILKKSEFIMRYRMN